MDNKILAFEYMMWRLIEYYKNNIGEEAEQAFDRLRAMKLLFFVSAFNTSKDNPGLLSTFNNFYAMPFGHVESDVYCAIKNNQYPESSKELLYNIDKTSRKNDPNALESEYFKSVPCHVKNIIDSNIENLFKDSKHLLNCDSFKLVELSHEWYSWKSTYEIARYLNKNSLPIESVIIQKEVKFYNI